MARGTPHLMEGYSATEDVFTRTLPVFTLVFLLEVRRRPERRLHLVAERPGRHRCDGDARRRLGRHQRTTGSTGVHPPGSGGPPRGDHLRGRPRPRDRRDRRAVGAGYHDRGREPPAPRRRSTSWPATGSSRSPAGRWEDGPRARRGGRAPGAGPPAPAPDPDRAVHQHRDVAGGGRLRRLVPRRGHRAVRGHRDDFLLTRLPRELGRLATFASVDELEELVAGTPAEGLAEPPRSLRPAPLSARQRGNVLLVALFSQGLQVSS